MKLCIILEFINLSNNLVTLLARRLNNSAYIHGPHPLGAEPHCRTDSLILQQTCCLSYND